MHEHESSEPWHTCQLLPEKNEEKHKAPYPLIAVPSDSVTAQRKVSDSRP